MRRWGILFFVLTVLMIVFPVMANQEDFVIDANGTLTEYHGNDEYVEIPETVKRIGKSVFKDNETMRYVLIPEGVEEIDTEAFRHTHLTEVYIPGSVKAVRYAAFAENYYLHTVDLEDGLEIIGAQAFYDSPEVGEILIPSSVNEIIGESPFNTRISVYDGSYAHMWAVEHNWGHSVDGWGDFTIADGVLYGYSGNEEYLEIPGDVERIACFALHANQSLKSLVIPASVKKIDHAAIAECHELEHVTLPDSLTEIDGWVFSSCNSLTEIDLPSGLNTIGDGLFNGCARLSRVDIPGAVTSIGSMAFAETWGLEIITVPASVTEIADDAFSPNNMLYVGSGSYAENWARSHNQRFHVDGGSAFTIENDVLVSYFGEDAHVVIPSTVKIIGDNAFRLNSTMTHVTIPDSVVEIRDGAFLNCSHLETIDIPGSVKTILWGAFAECPELKNVTIPDGVESVGEMAFAYCEMLDDVIFPDSVTSIGDDVIPSRATITANPGSYAADYAIEKRFRLHLTNSDEFTVVDGRLLSYTGKAENVVIPADRGIWAIGPSAFQENANLVSVVIPDGVSHIDEYAFAFSPNLVKADIPATVTYIGYRAFFHCDSLTDVELPAGLEEFDAGVFDYTALRSITIPAGVKFIASFYQCTDLESVTFLGEPDQIGYNAFYGDVSLKSITLPDSISLIEDWAFANSGLESVTLPAGIDTINWGVFSGSALREINIPNTVNLIRGEAFKECPNLETVTIAGSVNTIEDSAFAENHSLTTLNLGNGLDTIGWSAFAGCSNLRHVDIPGSVKNIQDWAFSRTGLETLNIPAGLEVIMWGTFENTRIRELVVPETVKLIRGNAFANNLNLEKVTISGSVQTIEYEAFAYDHALSSVSLGEGLETIDGRAFFECYALPEIQIPRSVKLILGNEAFHPSTKIIAYKDSYAADWAVENNWGHRYVDGDAGFLIIDGVLYSYTGDEAAITIPSTVRELAFNAFANNENLKSVKIPNSVEIIGWGAFMDCSNLETVEISDSVKVIGDYAFGWCPSLRSIHIPAGIDRLNEGLFAGSGLTSFTIPGNVKTVGSNVFEECRDLKEVVVNKGVEVIEHHAFYLGSGENSLTSVTLPEGLKSIGDFAFQTAYQISSLKIPASVEYFGDLPFNVGICLIVAKDSYAEQWAKDNGFGFRYESSTDWLIEDGVLYSYSGSASTVTIPSGVKHIARNAMSHNPNLVKVTIPAGVETIGGGAFSGCSNIEEVVIPSSVSYIGEFAFSGLEKMKSVRIPAGISVIEPGTFDGTGLTSVTIPEGVTVIGDGAFNWCYDLAEASLPSTLTSIGNDTFAVSRAMRTITIPASVDWLAEDSKDAFFWGTTILVYPGSRAESWAMEVGQRFQYVGAGNDFNIVGDKLYSYTGNAANVVIPSTVKTIGRMAFGDSSMKQVTIPESVTNIEPYAFAQCHDLESVTIPSGVIEIQDGTFLNNNKLKSVNLPANLKAVLSGAFADCASLTSVEIPDQVVVLWSAFPGCTGLADITIPASVTAMNDDAVPVTATIHTVKDSFAAEWGIAHGNKVVYGGGTPEVDKFSIYIINEFGEFVLADSVLTLDAGERDNTLQLAAVAPDGEHAITWKSSSAKVASVTNGLVTPLKAGNAKITASYKDGKKTVSASVTVKVVSKVLPGNITISGPESIAVGKTGKFIAKVGAQTPAPTNKAIVWVLGEGASGKVTVSSSGVVTGKAATTSPVEIKACAKDSLAADGTYTNCVSAPLNVTTAADGIAIELIDGTTTLDAGETVHLKAVVSPAAASQDVEWTAKSSNVADVNIGADGIVKVTAKAKGSISIKATTTDGTKKSATVKLTVGVKVKDGMLSIKEAPGTVAVKKTLKLTAVFNPVPSNKKVVWSITEGEANITLKNGTVAGVKPGHAVVQVCSEENPDVCVSKDISVIAPVTSVKLVPAKPQTLDIGGGSATLKVEADILPADATDKSLNWTSSKESVAVVDESGVVTAKGIGTTVITATAADGSKKSAKLTVKVVSGVQANSLKIEGAAHELKPKETMEMKWSFSQPNAPTNQKLTWKSSAPKVASVTSKGLVKGLAAGTAVITATSVDNKAVTAEWNITVLPLKSDEPLVIDAPEADAVTVITEEPLAEPEEAEVIPEETETAENAAEETTEPHFAVEETWMQVGESVILDVVNPDNEAVMVGLGGDTDAVLWNEELRMLTSIGEAEVTAFLSTIDPVEVKSMMAIHIISAVPEEEEVSEESGEAEGVVTEGGQDGVIESAEPAEGEDTTEAAETVEDGENIEAVEPSEGEGSADTENAAEETADDEAEEVSENQEAEEPSEVTETPEAEPVEIIIRDLGEDEALSGEANGFVVIDRERFELDDETLSGLVFEIENESVAKLTEVSAEEMLVKGIEIRLLGEGETRLVIRQEGSEDVLREIRLVVAAAPAAEEEPAVEEISEPVEEQVSEESGEETIVDSTLSEFAEEPAADEPSGEEGETPEEQAAE